MRNILKDWYFPYDLLILVLVVRLVERGRYQKQSGGWVQHLTAQTHFAGNVLMNGPHAAVNFNDGASIHQPCS